MNEIKNLKVNELIENICNELTYESIIYKDNIDIILKSDLNQRQSLFSSMYI
jgi:hypothetical protein